MKTFQQFCMTLAAVVLLYKPTQAANITVGSSTGQEVWGTWEKNSTITVNGHIVIPEGKSLVIEEGTRVLMNDSSLHIEIIVLGNLYSKGTPKNPVIFGVTDKYKSVIENQLFPKLWGGIICGSTCKEVLLLHTHIGYGGAVTTNSSPSVYLQLYKAEVGEGLPALNFRNNIDGKLVVRNCVIHNMAEDGLYLEGGQYIINNNLFYTTGETGGDAINLKAGSIADICYNIVFSPNTNALKLSNTGDRTPQCHAICYNNTIINAGWRRPTVKGGGIWMERDVIAEIYNNLHVNCRFALKNNKANAASKYDYQYYYGYDQETVNNFQSGVKDVVRGPNDIAGTVAGSNDPLFVNYPLNNDKYSAVFNKNWSFKLHNNSPALDAGTINFTRHFGTNGITIEGVTYYSPAPSKIIGALGTIVKVSGVTLTPQNVSLHVGQTWQLEASIQPTDADTTTITWSSSNESIATVDENGAVTALAEGSAIITATSINPQIKATCQVNVMLPSDIASYDIETIRIYPNPFVDYINVSLPKVPKNTWVTIYNLQGKLIGKQWVMSDKFKINLSHLKQGTYVLIIKSDDVAIREILIKK